jgi:hypothetical protein
VTSVASHGIFAAMPMLYLVIAALCLLFPDRAAVVCGVLMLTTWWRRQR